jgi:hypothetical protein
MPVLDRRVSLRGPRFWVEGFEVLRVWGSVWATKGEPKLMFAFQYDASTRDGPRLATDEDAKAHPEAYEAAQAETGLDPTPPGKPLVTALDPAMKPPPPPRPYAAKRQATLA